MAVVLAHKVVRQYVYENGGSKIGNKRHKSEEIVTKLRQVEVLVSQGIVQIDAIRQVRITEQIYYRWHKQYGGMGSDQLKELKRRKRRMSVSARRSPT